MVNIGKLGEEIIAEWLKLKNIIIIAQRWHCREGEIDIIALEKKTNTLIFVEVKTRNFFNNWDEHGLLAITEQKQSKILLTAENFLSKNVDFANYNCRFDLALVIYQPDSKIKKNDTLIISTNLNNSIFYQGYEFIIKNYLENIIN